jgi:hypothetical protein
MAIWATLAISAIVAVINKQMNVIPTGQFAFHLGIYGLMCVFPYKISKGSNAARYTFAVMTIFGYLFLLGGDIRGITKLDLASSIIIVPLDIFIFYRLFSKDANKWFSTRK